MNLIMCDPVNGKILLYGGTDKPPNDLAFDDFWEFQLKTITSPNNPPIAFAGPDQLVDGGPQ